MSVTIIPNERVDLSAVCPADRADYGDGMPLRTYRHHSGATVRIWGASLPKTDEENTARLRRAWAIADGIMERAALRGELDANVAG